MSSHAAPAETTARLRAVLDHIDAHQHGDLSLEHLSDVAAYSKFHFQRMFSARLQVGTRPYVQLVRMKRAAYRLAFREHHRVTDIALASGYGSQEAFGRAFRRVFGQTPSAFRAAPDWDAWSAVCRRLDRLRSPHIVPAHRPDEVRIVEVPARQVAMLRHRGDPAEVGASLQRFIAWRRAHDVPPHIGATFNVAHDDPTRTSPAAYRLDICAAVSGGVDDNPFGVVAATIPGGRCAVLRHVGPDDTLPASVNFLTKQWLSASGERRRDRVLYLHRIRLFPEVSEHQAVTDVFLPIA